MHFELITNGKLLNKDSFSIQGKDAQSFLDNLTTQSVQKTSVSFHCILNTKGQVRFEFWCVPALDEEYILVCDTEIKTGLFQHLEMLHFAEKVDFHEKSYHFEILEADRMWQNLDEFTPWAKINLDLESITSSLLIDNGLKSAYYSLFSNQPGILLVHWAEVDSPTNSAISGASLFKSDISKIIPHLSAESLSDILSEVDSQNNTGTNQEHLAIIYSSGFLPFVILENKLFNHLGLFAQYLDEDKGCYPGQEIVTRIAQRGKTNKKLFPQVYQEASNNCFPLSDKGFIGSDFENPNESKSKPFPLFTSMLMLETSDALYNKALKTFHEGDFEKSTQMFLRSISLNPLNADLWEGLGVNYERQGKLDLAIKTHREFSRLSPLSVMAWANLSRLYMLKGWIDKAEEVQDKARELHFLSSAEENSQSQKAIVETQNQLQAEKDKRKATFEMVLGIDPEDDIALFGLGKFYVDKKQFEKSLEYLVLLLKVKPDYAAAWPLLAKAYIGVKNFEGAQKSITQGREVCQTQGAMVPLRLLDLQFKKLP